MTNTEKIALTREAKGTYGLTPLPPSERQYDVAALELSRSPWCYNISQHRTYTEKYAHLREPLEEMARSHPGYGTIAARRSCRSPMAIP